VPRSAPSRRETMGGRRRNDLDPRVTFTKKFLVIVVAVVNAIYLVSELFLKAINAC